MSKKNKKQNEEQLDNQEVYKLNKKAIDVLVEAHSEAAQADEPAEKIAIEKDIKRFTGNKFLQKIPVWVKAILIKYWFNGMICFFFFWGIGEFLADSLDAWFLMSVAHGLAIDLLVNNIFRFIESDKLEYSKYAMFPRKKLWTIFANVLYAAIVCGLVMLTYNQINIWIIAARGLEKNAVPLGVEPLLYGLFYLAFDMLFISAKNMIILLFKKLKNR